MTAPERPLSHWPVGRLVKCTARRRSVRTLAAVWALAASALLSTPAEVFGFQRIDAITLESGENFALQAVIDPAGDFAYIATDTGPVRVVKIDLATFERVDAITLEDGENAPYAVLIDHPGDFLYIGTISFPGRVVKIDLETFERVGAITLETGENSLSSAVIDPAGDFVYFGTGTLPGRLVKIDLATFERVDAITMEPDEDWLLAGVIDPAGEFAYFGTGTTTRQVVKVDLVTFERVDAIDLGAGEFDQILSAVIDPAGEFAYFGTGDFPGQVTKIDLTSFEHVETIALASGEDFLFSAAIDPTGDFAYFGTFGEPGHVVKIALEPFARAEALTLEPGEDWVLSAVVDPAGELAYFGTATEPGKVVRVGLVDGAPIADIAPESFDFEVEVGGSDTQILTVGNPGTADLVWAVDDAELIAFTHEGSGNGTLDGKTFEATDFVITSVADPDEAVPVPPFMTFVPNLSSSIAIDGVGTFDFLIATMTGAEHLGQFGAPAVVFGPLVAGEPVGVLWGPLDGAFATWDTTTPIGPINGPGFHLGWGFQSMETTGGTLAFDDTDLDGELPTFAFTAADHACDDVADIAWLSVEPEDGTTPPQESAPVSVTVDATDLSPGTFDATLCVTTNDPNAPLVMIPVALTVTGGGSPELSFDPTLLDFGDVEVGTTSPPQTAMLHNTGDADATGLVFSGLPAAGFEADTGACGDTLPAGGSCVVSVTFTPSTAGPATATLHVDSAEGAMADLALSGNGIEPEGPVADVSPAAFAFEVPQGGGDSDTLSIGNLGDADLIWTIDEAEPGLVLAGASYRYGLTPMPEFHSPVGADRATSAGRPATPEAAGVPAGRGAGLDAGTYGRDGARPLQADHRVLPAPQPAAVGSLTEDFDDITQLPGAGWAMTNNSEPTGPSSWFQGNDSIFPSHEGAPNAYIAANFESTDGTGDISNWLLTPEVTIVNGTTACFWTRTSEQFEEFYDRLEVRMSIAGDSTDVGNTAESVGDFTALLLSINPDLMPDEYPEEWTQFCVTVRERSREPVTGRFAFRYWVTDSGPNGSNGDYIGIDTASVTQPDDMPPEGCDDPADIPWLAADPTSGTTAPGASEPVNVMVDATDLEVGEHTAQLCVTTNDPNTPLVEVPVTLTVTGGNGRRFTDMRLPSAAVNPGQMSALVSRNLELELYGP